MKWNQILADLIFGEPLLQNLGPSIRIVFAPHNQTESLQNDQFPHNLYYTYTLQSKGQSVRFPRSCKRVCSDFRGYLYWPHSLPSTGILNLGSVCTVQLCWDYLCTSKKTGPKSDEIFFVKKGNNTMLIPYDLSEGSEVKKPQLSEGSSLLGLGPKKCHKKAWPMFKVTTRSN